MKRSSSGALCPRYAIEPFIFFAASSLTIGLFCFNALVLESSCLHSLSKNECVIVLGKNCSTDVCYSNQTIVQGKAAKWSLIANTCFGLTSTLSAVFYGVLGNVLNNRKMVLVIITFGNLVCCLVMVLAYTFTRAIHRLVMAVIFQLLSGVLGGIMVAIMMSNSYLTAVTNAENRTRRFTFMEVILLIAIMSGLLISGLTLDGLGFLPTAYIALALCSISFAYLIFLMGKPETEPNDKYKRWNSLYPYRVMLDIFSLFTANRPKEKRTKLRLVSSVALLNGISMTGVTSIMYNFLRKSPLSMSNSEVGAFNAWQYCLQALGLVTMQTIISRFKWHLPDTTMVQIGYTCKFLQYLTLGLANKKAVAYVALLFCVFSSTDAPAIRSLLTKQVDDGEQGQLFGMLASFQGMGLLFSQFIVQNLYKYSLSWYGGFVFILLAGLVLVQGIIMIVAGRIEMRDRTYRVPINQISGCESNALTPANGQFQSYPEKD